LNEGELELLDKMLKDPLTTDEDYSLRLFKNDYTPVQGSTGSDFTVADFTSYTNKTLTRSGWGSATTVSNKASATYGTVQTWTAGSSQTIYGYYIVAATSGKVLWAERFSASKSLVSTDQLNITPVITLNSEN
jgi:hypothetical protein